MNYSCSWEGKGRCGSFGLRIERVGVQVKLQDPLRTHAIPERFWGGVSRTSAISSVRTFTLPVPLVLLSSPSFIACFGDSYDQPLVGLVI